MNRKLPAEAFQFYLGLGIDRSYQKVAEHFRVAKGTVTALARKDDWQTRLAKVEREARNRADEKAVETMDARILIVDDDRRIRDMLQRSFVADGYRVDLADTAEKGLESVRTMAPDVVVLDVGLPLMDGFEACRRIRREGHRLCRSAGAHRALDIRRGRRRHRARQL